MLDIPALMYHIAMQEVSMNLDICSLLLVLGCYHARRQLHSAVGLSLIHWS